MRCEWIKVMKVNVQPKMKNLMHNKFITYTLFLLERIVQELISYP